VKVKPVIPGIPTSEVGKLPHGWRMVTSAEGKPYYFNKKTGETSWEPPPPTAGGEEEGADLGEKLDAAKDFLKFGFRRAKMVFKGATNEDTDLDKLYERVLSCESQVKQIKKMMEDHMRALVDMCWSGEQLAIKFGDYLSEPGAVGSEAAAQSATIWKELQKGAQRSLEVQFTSKVLQPIAGYLGEIEGIKALVRRHPPSRASVARTNPVCASVACMSSCPRCAAERIPGRGEDRTRPLSPARVPATVGSTASAARRCWITTTTGGRWTR
jgi:hypothetical protein